MHLLPKRPPPLRPTKRRSQLQQLQPSMRQPRLSPPRSSFSDEICDDGLFASHNASKSPHFASTRCKLVECSETPMRVWSGGRHNVPEREISWLTKPTARNRLSNTHMHPARAAAMLVTPALAPVLAPHVPPALLVAVQAAASSSGARRSASSAPRRSTPSPIATFACCRASLPSVARSFRAALPVFAHATSASSA